MKAHNKVVIVDYKCIYKGSKSIVSMI